MKQLLETIAKALVDQPDQVRVNEIATDKSIVYELSVAPNDMGKIIGKQGRVAKAIRAVVSAAALQEQKRVTIEIV
ncbi:MAG TPA: KH domain-containing protein [Bacilli bacterium]|nr:KH domain-containing protein [Bacilli bacterium]